MLFTDYYKTLGISTTASAEDIKVAHRTMSKQFHPDVNTADEFYEIRFNEVQEANKVLSDPKTRKLYNRVYRKYSKLGVAAGSTIYIPDSAGKSGWSWHPDFRALPDGVLVGKRTSLLVGLVIVATTGACALLFWGSGGKQPKFISDWDAFYTKSQPAPRQETTAAGIRTASVYREASSRRASVEIPDAAPVRAGTSAAPVRIVKEDRPQRPSQQVTGNEVGKVQHFNLPQTLSLLKAQSSLPLQTSNPTSLPYTPPINVAFASLNLVTTITRIDTDQSDLMVRRVTQVQFGYTIFLVKRSFYFNDRRPHENRTIRYASSIRVFRPADLLDRDKIIRKSAAECSLIEDKLTRMTGDFTMHYAITYQMLKTFGSEAEAMESLRCEGKVIQLKM